MLCDAVCKRCHFWTKPRETLPLHIHFLCKLWIRHFLLQIRQLFLTEVDVLGLMNTEVEISDVLMCVWSKTHTHTHTHIYSCFCIIFIQNTAVIVVRPRWCSCFYFQPQTFSHKRQLGFDMSVFLSATWFFKFFHYKWSQSSILQPKLLMSFPCRVFVSESDHESGGDLRKSLNWKALSG